MSCIKNQRMNPSTVSRFFRVIGQGPCRVGLRCPRGRSPRCPDHPVAPARGESFPASGALCGCEPRRNPPPCVISPVQGVAYSGSWGWPEPSSSDYLPCIGCDQIPAGTRRVASDEPVVGNAPGRNARVRDQTDSRARPLARRALMTARPFLVLMRARKPCVRLRFKLLG
jgi:hypothetical protein